MISETFRKFTSFKISVDVVHECEITFVFSPSLFYVRPFPSIVDDIENELR